MLDELPPGFTVIGVVPDKMQLELPCKCRIPIQEPVEPKEINVPILDPEAACRGFRERLVRLAAVHICR